MNKMSEANHNRLLSQQSCWATMITAIVRCTISDIATYPESTAKSKLIIG